MFYDSFLCEQQIDEIIPEEYEDWLRFCAGAYEEAEYELHDHFEEDADDCFEPGRPIVYMFDLNP